MEQKVSKDFSGAEFYIVAPSKTRKRFAVVARFARGRPEQRTETLELDTIKATNRLYVNGKISREEAHEALSHLIKSLKGEDKKKKPAYLKANKTLVDDYFAKVYGPREIVSPQSAYNRLLRAIKAVGNLPLTTASDLEIFQTVRGYEPDQRLRKRLISTLSQLFRYIGRTDIQIPRIKKQRASVRHVTLKEFTEIIGAVADSGFASLCWAAFATGCRPGELFGLSTASYNDASKSVFIADQVDVVTGERRSTKTGERRHAVVIPEARSGLLEWLSLDEQERERIRKLRHSELFRRAARTALPSRKDNFVFYDLRHSYAICLLNKGISIDFVAQALGNSISVCQEHYLGFVLTSGGIETMSRILNS